VLNAVKRIAQSRMMRFTAFNTSYKSDGLFLRLASPITLDSGMDAGIHAGLFERGSR
jgi:hypothetical protein